MGSNSNRRLSGGPWKDSSILMSLVRARNRSMLTRASMRDRGPPGQAWMPRPNARCSLAFGRSGRNSPGSSKRAGSRFGGLREDGDRAAGRDLHVGDGGGDAGDASRLLDHTLVTQHLLDEVRDAIDVGAEVGLELGVLGDDPQRGRDEPSRGVLARREDERGHAAHDIDVGDRPVGVRDACQLGEHVLARFAAAVLDVLREPVL